jgi:hypothetical protein
MRIVPRSVNRRADEDRLILVAQLQLLYLRAKLGLPVTVGALLRTAFLVRQVDGEDGEETPQ